MRRTAAGGENRLGIAHAKRLQPLQKVEELGSHLVERQDRHRS